MRAASGGRIERELSFNGILRELPSDFRPIRLSRRSEPFDSKEFLFELKIDGFRALAHIDNGEYRLVSCNGCRFRGFADLANWIVFRF